MHVLFSLVTLSCNSPFDNNHYLISKPNIRGSHKATSRESTIAPTKQIIQKSCKFLQNYIIIFQEEIYGQIDLVEMFSEPIQHVMVSFLSTFHLCFTFIFVPHSPSMRNPRKYLHKAINLHHHITQ